MTDTGTADNQPDGAPEADSGDQRLAELPAPVRNRVLQWSAAALDGAAPDQVPAALTRVARFAPAKRATRGATLLTQVLEGDAAFRAFLAEWIARRQSDPATQDPVGAAAAAYLLRLPELGQLLAHARLLADRGDDRARVLVLEGQVRSLTAKLQRAGPGSGVAPPLEGQPADSQPAGDRVAANRPAGTQPTANRPAGTQKASRAAPHLPGGSGSSSQPAPDEVADRLRQRLRDQGGRLRELQEQFAAAAAKAADEVAAVTADRDRARADADSWRRQAEAASLRADAAVLEVGRSRDEVKERRLAADRRVELLLSAVEAAASGLRRELDLRGGGPSPAQVMAARLPTVTGSPERTSDPARLTAWAGLPSVHLVVDGYNVTKSGWPELSLSDQRDRLVRALATMAARTSAEVTVVFDGAAVVAKHPPGRGVRVLFSPPGVTADEIIDQLVRAEPVGRAVVVVSSDREVADRAAADGARTAASSALLGLFG